MMMQGSAECKVREIETVILVPRCSPAARNNTSCHGLTSLQRMR